MTGLFFELIEFLLFPYVAVFHLLTRFRRWLFEKGIGVVRLGCRVISVGNITTGGTGKTTLVLDLLQLAKKKKLRAAVVSRSYKAKQREPARIDPSRMDGAALYGDEAFLIATEHPDCPVYVGRSKKEAAQKCYEEIRPDLIIVDDGFQHFGLWRDLDILIFDAAAPGWHYLYLPLGRLREAMAAIRKAQIFVVSKSRFAKSRWRPWAKFIPSSASILFMDYSAGDLVDLQTQRRHPAANLQGAKVLLVSGIAGPRTFEQMVDMDIPVQIVSHLRFADHHSYSSQDVAKIQDRFQELGCQHILMTAKDAVKLRGKLNVSAYSVDLKRDSQGLEEMFRGVFHG